MKEVREERYSQREQHMQKSCGRRVDWRHIRDGVKEAGTRPEVREVGKVLQVTENGNCLLRAMKNHGGNYRGSNEIRFFFSRFC